MALQRLGGKMDVAFARPPYKREQVCRLQNCVYEIQFPLGFITGTWVRLFITDVLFCSVPGEVRLERLLHQLSPVREQVIMLFFQSN